MREGNSYPLSATLKMNLVDLIVLIGSMYDSKKKEEQEICSTTKR